MQLDIVLAKLDTARNALAEAKTIQETKKILDVAAAVEILAKRQQLGEEAVQYATSIKVEALAQLGRMLKETAGQEQRQTRGGDRKSKSAKDTLIFTPTLSDLGLDKRTSKLAQDIAALPEKKLEAVKAGILSLSKAVSSPHVSHNSGENEWYTPPEYIVRAKKVMGRIDLDPASSEKANTIVGASRFYTKSDNGLEQFWAGRIWMNPPYASELIGLFISKYVEHVNNGDIKEGFVFVNNATETAWFSALVSVSVAILFPTGRIKFLDVELLQQGAPLQGQALAYYGENIEKFKQEFKGFGWIAKL